MIFDYSLAALVAAGLLCYLIYACCGLSDFNADLVSSGCPHGRSGRSHDAHIHARAGIGGDRDKFTVGYQHCV
jgi:hypothetical protein